MIEARGLSKRFGNVVAVDDLSFDVRPGTVTGFLGPNGSGKSTTMRMIMGLDLPASGTVTVLGRRYHDLPWPLREVGGLLEAKAIHPGRSARAHLLTLARSNAIPRARVDEVLELVGLTSVAGKRAGKFSLGMGQRLGIAAALLGDPGVLLFDEPVNGLDPEGIRWVRTLCKKLAGEGRTVFVSSHLMAEMALTADHLVVIGKGKMIAETSVADFVARSSRQSVKVRTPAPHQVVRRRDQCGRDRHLRSRRVDDRHRPVGTGGGRPGRVDQGRPARTDPRRLTGGRLHGADRRSRRVPRWIVTAVLEAPAPFAIEQPPGRVGLRRAMAAEWTKFWSVRSTMWTLVATGVAVVGLCALSTGTVSPSDIIDDPTRRSLIGIFLGQLIFGVLGVLVMSAEYGTGTIRATLSAVPRRPVVLSRQDPRVRSGRGGGERDPHASAPSPSARPSCRPRTPSGRRRRSRSTPSSSG